MSVDFSILQKRVLAAVQKIELPEDDPNTPMMKSLHEQMAIISVMAIAEYEHMRETLRK